METNDSFILILLTLLGVLTSGFALASVLAFLPEVAAVASFFGFAAFWSFIFFLETEL